MQAEETIRMTVKPGSAIFRSTKPYPRFETKANSSVCSDSTSVTPSVLGFGSFHAVGAAELDYADIQKIDADLVRMKDILHRVEKNTEVFWEVCI